jgi:hypothetical protein
MIFSPCAPANCKKAFIQFDTPWLAMALASPTNVVGTHTNTFRREIRQIDI